MFFSDREISICAIILTPLANCVQTACLLLLFLILDSDDEVTDNDEQDEEAESSSDEEVRKQPLLTTNGAHVFILSWLRMV